MNQCCPKCNSLKLHSHGTFRRKSDAKLMQRWRCGDCRCTFSQATFSTCYRQKKRRVNAMLGKLLSSGISQRRAALVLKLTRKTVARKLIFLGTKAKWNQQDFVRTLGHEELKHIQIDDLITSHHTKLKPLSLTLVVSKKSRHILAASLSEIPAFGHLADISLRKYGKRQNELGENLQKLGPELKALLPKTGTIDSDQHALYPAIVKRHLPGWQHQTFKGQRASVAGLGELKSKARDPLFSINHTLAMLRANINRLFRRTWNTTKKPENLMHHFWLYADFHNGTLTGK